MKISRDIAADTDHTSHDPSPNQDGVEVQIERGVCPHSEVGTERYSFRIRDVDQTSQSVQKRKSEGCEHQGSVFCESNDQGVSYQIHQW